MSRAKKVNKLSDLSIDEVSLVDRGANQHASVVLSKRHEDGEEEGDDEVAKGDPDSSSLNTEGGEQEPVEETFDKTTSKDEEEEVGKGFFSRLVNKVFSNGEFTTDTNTSGSISDMNDVAKANAFNKDPNLPYGQGMQGAPAPGPQNAMPPGMQAFPAGQPVQDPTQMMGQGMMGQQGQTQPGQMQAGPPLPAEVVQYIQQLEQALAQAQGSSSDNQHQEENVNPFGKSADNLDEDEVTFLQELSKSLEDEDTREAVTKAMEAVTKANERAEAAENIAKSERDHRLNQEFVAKARSYTNLPVSPDEFGPVLKRLHETMSDEDVEVITKALSTANETVATYFTEVGKRGIDGYESVSKVDARAKEMVEKSDGSLTMEQARERVFEEDPSAYDEYLNETGR